MYPELLRTDMGDTARRLTSCYNRCWETERWLKVCKKGVVVKVFKKGDLCDCNSWRGVTLLPVISKIFCGMLLEWIKKGVDKKRCRESLWNIMRSYGIPHKMGEC